MSKRQQRRDEGNRKSRPQNRAVTLWISIVLSVAVIGGGVFIATQLSSPSVAETGRSSEPPSPSAPDLLSEADQDRALRREQLEAAQELLAHHPTNDDAVYLAGLIHEDQGNSEEAMKLWARSIELDATRADANESLGQALLLRDDYAAAEKYFRRALALDSNSPSARFRLATALSHEGRVNEALSALEQSRGFSAEGYRLMGEICAQLKQHERAKTNYEAAIQLKPDFPEAWYGLALTLAQLGDEARSRECLDKSTALRKESDEQARRVRTDFDALAVTRKSVARTHTDVGRVYMNLGQRQKAEGLWRRAAQVDPDNILCRLQLAVLCQQTKRGDEALRFYEEAARLDPKDGLTQLNLGRVCMNLNRPERAERAFQEVIRLEPKRPDGYAALAQLYLHVRHNLPEAERLAGVAVQLAPEAPYFLLLSQACAQNANQSGALSAINKALELQPGNPQFVQMRNAIIAGQR